MMRLGTPAEVALAMATTRPAKCLRREAELGRLVAGRNADMVHLREDGSLSGVWRQGNRML